MDEMNFIGTPTSEIQELGATTEPASAGSENKNEVDSFLMGLLEDEEEDSGTPTELELETEASDPDGEENNQERSADAGENIPDEVIEITHLGKKIPLKKDELVTYAQKGIDYDHVRENRDRLLSEVQQLKKDQETAEFFRQEAEKYGLSVQGYIESVQIGEKIRELKAQYGDKVPENVLADMAKLAVEKGTVDRQAEMRSQELGRENAKLELKHKIFKVMEQNQLEQLPEEALQYIAQGFDPETAYQLISRNQLAEENRQMKQQLQMFQKNKENLQKAVPKRVVSGVQEEIDPFLQGLLGR